MEKFSQQTTPGGYLKGEVASALQKCLRRGDERGALFWATELELAGHGEYVWKRLRIIASEDVGIADSTVALTVRALYDNWRELSKQVRGAQARRVLPRVHRPRRLPARPGAQEPDARPRSLAHVRGEAGAPRDPRRGPRHAYSQRRQAGPRDPALPREGCQAREPQPDPRPVRRRGKAEGLEAPAAALRARARAGRSAVRRVDAEVGWQLEVEKPGGQAGGVSCWSLAPTRKSQARSWVSPRIARPTIESTLQPGQQWRGDALSRRSRAAPPSGLRLDVVDYGGGDRDADDDGHGVSAAEAAPAAVAAAARCRSQRPLVVDRGASRAPARSERAMGAS